MTLLRRLAARLQRTPLHPQWLLGRRRPPPGLRQRHGRVLDIGSADGWIRTHLSNSAEYVALDYPPTGRDLYEAEPDVYADVAALPFVDASFDDVICLEVIEHVSRPDAAFAEIARVLRTGGIAWISVPFLYPIHDAPHDYQRLTEHGLRRDAARAGLEVISIRRQGNALCAAGLVFCLALAGAVFRKSSAITWLLAVPLLPMLVVVNLGTWLLAHCWPDWDALATGYELEARRS